MILSSILGTDKTFIRFNWSCQDLHVWVIVISSTSAYLVGSA